MKANEFVKKFGWGKAKGITALMQEGVVNYDGISVNYDDLKRYVDAYELISKFGGLKRAQRILKKSYGSWNTMVSVVWNDKPFQCTVEELQKAIANVEGCQ